MGHCYMYTTFLFSRNALFNRIWVTDGGLLHSLIWLRAEPFSCSISFFLRLLASFSYTWFTQSLAFLLLICVWHGDHQCSYNIRNRNGWRKYAIKVGGAFWEYNVFSTKTTEPECSCIDGLDIQRIIRIQHGLETITMYVVLPKTWKKYGKQRYKEVAFDGVQHSYFLIDNHQQVHLNERLGRSCRVCWMKQIKVQRYFFQLLYLCTNGNHLRLEILLCIHLLQWRGWHCVIFQQLSQPEITHPG